MEKAAYQEKVLEVEPYGIEVIPEEERHGHSSQMFPIWFAINLNVVTWFTGFLGIEFGLSVNYAILAILIGNIFGAAFLALSSSIGPELGRPLIPASKNSFGNIGVFLLSFLNLLNNIGWFAVNVVLAVMAMQKILPLGYFESLIIIVAITLLVAIFGYNFIHVFARWMSVIIGILFVIMSVITVKNLPFIFSNIAPKGSVGFNLGMFILTIAVTFSYQISYTPIGADYARYLPSNTSKKSLWKYSFLGAFSVCLWLELLGALTATMGINKGPMDFFAQIMGVFTIPAIITAILSILPVNVMAIYSGGLASLAMGFPLKRWLSAIITAGIGALLAFVGKGNLSETYTNFLLLLSYWIVPWFGVLFCDFYYQASDKFAGIIAFLCGVIVSIPFMHSALYVGPIARKYLGGADISYFVSLTVSILVYYGILVKTKAVSEKFNSIGQKHL